MPATIFYDNDADLSLLKGKTIAILGYPNADFPPTDFHSATPVGDSILIIGRQGYADKRLAGTTPVYKLNLHSMRMSAVETHGEPPGWIYRHSATLSDEGPLIRVSGGERWTSGDQPMSTNIDSWSLNTATGEWRRVRRATVFTLSIGMLLLILGFCILAWSFGIS